VVEVDISTTTRTTLYFLVVSVISRERDKKVGGEGKNITHITTPLTVP